MRTSRTSRRWLARKPRLLRPCQNSRGLRSRREPDQTSPVAGINDLPPQNLHIGHDSSQNIAEKHRSHCRERECRSKSDRCLSGGPTGERAKGGSGIQ